MRKAGTRSRRLTRAADVADLFSHRQFETTGIEPRLCDTELLDPLMKWKLVLIGCFE